MKFMEHASSSEPDRPATVLHRNVAQDLALLRDSRVLLLQRLERVMIALALTLDAEAAAEERLALTQETAGAHRIGNRPPVQWMAMAQRYRDVLREIESINDQVLLETGDVRR